MPVGSEPPPESSKPARSVIRRARVRVGLHRLAHMARVVAEADAAKIESAAREFGSSRRYLAPVAWAAGAIVLVIRGIKLLVLNWRLSLIQLVPAAWVWVVMWDLKAHALRGAAFRELTVGGMILLGLVAVGLSIAAFWCNTVFAFAIDGGQEPRIAPAAQRAHAHLSRITIAGLTIGLLLTFAAVVIPRIGSKWLYVITLGAVLGLMLITFVAIPARIIGAKRERLPPKQAVARAAAGGALSAVAMTPGFVLDRVGLILLGVPGLNILGFLFLSAGTALYAAGMSSVRAVKLSMKLAAPATETL